jgi:hypothetical protein
MRHQGRWSGEVHVPKVRKQEVAPYNTHEHRLLLRKEARAFIGHNNNATVAESRTFLTNHRKYCNVTVSQVLFALNRMSDKPHGNKKVTDELIQFVIERVKAKRSPRGENGKGPEQVTTKDIKAMIQEKHHDNEIQYMHETKKAVTNNPLCKATMENAWTRFEELSNMEFFHMSRVRLRRRLEAENDLRSILSYMGLMDLISRLPTDCPLQGKTDRIPFELIINIDSTTVNMDQDLKNKPKGTWDLKDATDHPITVDSQKMPWNSRITAITSGTGAGRFIICIKAPPQYCTKPYVQVNIPGHPNIMVIVTKGSYDIQYFRDQVSVCCGTVCNVWCLMRCCTVSYV